MAKCMIESVKARQRGAHDFEGYYSQLCALQDSCPLTAVKSHLADGVLDLNADRIRQHDWMPILNALRINRSLQFIGIRSYYQQNGKQDGESRSRSQMHLRRPPPIRSRDVTYRVCAALRECLMNSEQLQHVELQGLLLRENDVVALCKGLAKTRCLQHVSLEYCRIGDTGVESLCHCIKNTPTIVSLNLTATGLTWKSAELLAKLVKHQATKRHTEAWKDSLRYRRPDLDRMPGIRRITINNNPLINDKGALALAEALKDDLWLKALDMQHCGLSNVGAKAFLDAAQQNTSIVVLDVRRNPLIDRDLLKAVIEQVMINSGGQENEYKWLRARSPKDPASKPRTRKRGRTSSGRTRKAGGSNGATSSSSQKIQRTRSKSASGVSVRTTSSKSDFHPVVTKPGPGFVPWRTAARASHRRGMPMEPGTPSGSSTPSKPGASSIHVHVGSSTPSSELDTSAKDSMATFTTQMSTTVATEGAFEVALSRKMKDMQVEVEELRRRFYIESRARAAADARIVELEVENSRLKHEIQLLEARGPTSPLRRTRGGEKKDEGEEEEINGEDEALLESIEASFKKFHGFLDLLRDAGLGQLCSLVGLSQEDIRHPLVKSILQNHQPVDQRPVSNMPTSLPSTYQPGPYPNQTFYGLPTNIMQPTNQMMPGMPTAAGMQPTNPMLFGAQSTNQMATGVQPMNFGLLGTHPPNQMLTGVQLPNQQIAGMQSNTRMFGMQLSSQTILGAPMAHQSAVPSVSISQPSSSNLSGNTPAAPQPDPSPRIPIKITGTNLVSTSHTSAPVRSSSHPQPAVSAAHIQQTHVSTAGDIPSESLSSTAGIYTPHVVQISSAVPSKSDGQTTSSGTNVTTVISQHKSRESRAADDVTDKPEGAQNIDKERDRHDDDDDVSGGRGEEPLLPKASDSLDFDLGNVKQMTELDFVDSVESTPRYPPLSKDGEKDERIESTTPTKGLGSPTESDHSARGSRHSSAGGSRSPQYSEDFEGNDDDNDDESEIEEDLFEDSPGGIPGLSSDEDF